MFKTLDWKAAAWSGLIAGAVFLMVEMAMVAFIQGMSPWGPPRMMAAIVMGESVLPAMDQPATFDLVVMMVAMMVHLVLSMVMGFVFAAMHGLMKMNLVTALVAGTVFGLVVYAINFYVFTAVFPWFAMARGMVSIVGHAVFGLVLGWAYHALAKPSLGAPEARTT